MDIQIEITKSGLPTAKINNYYLHSKYDPLKEADTFVKNNYNKGKTVIFYGYGLGYIIKKYKKNRKLQEKIIVIDPFLDIKEPDAENIYYIDCNKINQLTSYLNAIITDKDSGITEVICSLNYRKINENIYTKIYETISNVLKAKIINYNTIQSMAWSWYDNFLDNMRFAFLDNTITDLFNRYTCPIIVVAGGPSLTKQLTLLQKVKGKCVILCAGSTIRTLLKHNIEPDYIINVDGGQKNLQHFENMENSKINYIYGLQSTKGIRASFKGSCYYFSPYSEPLSIVFANKYIPSVKKIEGGVSVATYTLALAHYISSGPIAIIGQDLAYTNNSSHAEGNIQRIEQHIKENHFYKKVTGYYDCEVFSDASLISMKDSLELVLQTIDAPRKNIFNCTEGGAKINYVQQLPFEQFIYRFIGKDQQNIVVEEGSEKKNNKYRELLEKGLELLLKRIQELKKCINLIEKRKQTMQAMQTELEKCKNVIEQLNLQGLVNYIELNMSKKFEDDIYINMKKQITVAYEKNEYLFKELLNMFERVEGLYKDKLKNL